MTLYLPFPDPSPAQPLEDHSQCGSWSLVLEGQTGPHLEITVSVLTQEASAEPVGQKSKIGVASNTGEAITVQDDTETQEEGWANDSHACPMARHQANPEPKGNFAKRLSVKWSHPDPQAELQPCWRCPLRLSRQQK